MATPPMARKMAPERPFPILIETGKSYSKTGLLPAVFPAVFRQFCQWFPRRFPGGFPAVSRRFSRQVRRRFDSRFPATRFPLDQPPAGSGPPFEKRESGNYSDTLINAILSRAQGKTLAIPAATAALEMCAGVVGRSRR